MKRTWLKSNSICMAMGDAVALNLMFENKDDHELFFTCWNKYLGNMATLIHYHLTPTSWILLFKTKSSEEIISAYKEQRSLSRKAKKANTHEDVSRMLSEHFRIFLSQYVRRTNANHGRKGTKVLQRFHRYVFRKNVDYEKFFDMLTRQVQKSPQSNVKYRANETTYDPNKEITKDSIWKVGTRMYQGLEDGFRDWIGATLIKPRSSVLRKYLSSSKFRNIHPPYT